MRAGSPPSAVEMIKRYSRLKRLEQLGELWTAWEAWFVDLEESHTSLAALSFFRSPQPHRSWVIAAGAVLDGAALVRSVVDIPADSQADLCIRAGYLALRYIAAFFRISYNPNPSPSDPISVSRAEFEAALDEMAEASVPLKADREQAWRDFAGWRSVQHEWSPLRRWLHRLGGVLSPSGQEEVAGTQHRHELWDAGSPEQKWG